MNGTYIKRKNKIQRLMLLILATMTFIIAKHQKRDLNYRYSYRYPIDTQIFWNIIQASIRIS